MTQNFKRLIEDFVCGHCGQKVVGNGFTNHCPSCLWSKHVDINPGDRAESCGGLMKPINIILSKGNYQIVQQCQTCGESKKNKAGQGDNIGQFLANML